MRQCSKKPRRVVFPMCASTPRRFWLPLQPRQCREGIRGKVMKLVDGFDSNYRYILVAARRARQLQSGARPLVDSHSRKPCRVAQDEIRAGKVKWYVPETPKSAVDVASEM